MSVQYSRIIICLLLLFSEITFLNGQKLSENIRLNQLGFYPNANKIAVVIGEVGGNFYLMKPDLKDTLFKAKLSEPRNSLFSDKKTRIADFSAFKTTGKFVIYLPALGFSHQFEIRKEIHNALVKGSIKGFYYQRASTALPQKYAGEWSRAAGHPDNHILVHSSAATKKRPEGTVILSPKGWYDAGDYNKYIVNSGITMGTLFSLYEDFPSYFDTLKINIPENTNKIPDLLDETLWNLRWMLTMQDPEDGGVYHKLTNSGFDGMIMPSEAKNPRYAVQKSTAAALDFAAVMAQASRIFRNFKRELPGLADSCLSTSIQAWEWSQKNPAVLYNQREMNKEYDPDVTTGDYGDRNLNDEFIWAATELYITTKKDSYYSSIKLFPDDNMPLPDWPQVRLLGYYTLARFTKQLTPLAKQDFPELKKRLIAFFEEMIKGVPNNPYGSVMGASASNFKWGSNSFAANQGIALIQAYRLTTDKKYLDYALSNLDYLLGRNATGYSFVTGYGDKPPLNPHHRPSIGDGVILPVPGLLVGGPNPSQQDSCNYPSKVADESYVDHDCSYASNEIAINWNAPLVYLVSALEALSGKL